MELEKSKVLIKFLLNFTQSGDVLFFLNVRRLRGYTATAWNLNACPQSLCCNTSTVVFLNARKKISNFYNYWTSRVTIEIMELMKILGHDGDQMWMTCLNQLFKSGQLADEWNSARCSSRYRKPITVQIAQNSAWFMKMFQVTNA